MRLRRSLVVNIFWFFFLVSCGSTNSAKPKQYNSSNFYQSRQPYYYPRPQPYYYYPPVNIPNSRYYSDPYAQGYPDQDSYYSVPTYYNSYREDEEKARERSSGVADEMLD